MVGNLSLETPSELMIEKLEFAYISMGEYLQLSDYCRLIYKYNIFYILLI
jgi:hypothetical protein